MPRSPHRQTDGFAVARPVLDALRAQLPVVAPRTVAAVVAEVPDYADPLQGRLGENITEAVELALGTFLRLVGPGRRGDPDSALQAALDGAYALGRGEAREGRTIDALLAAYRVGARVAWAQWGSAAVTAGLPAEGLVALAEQVFAYIDQLSAASVAGHGDELAVSGRVREQYRERLGRALVNGAPEPELTGRAERAGWSPPDGLLALLVPAAHARTVAAADRRTLALSADVLDDERLPTDTSLLLVPADRASRAGLSRALGSQRHVIGPAVPWLHAARSYERTARVAAQFGMPPGGIDTEEVLAELVLGADADAMRDLRAQALAPLDDLPPATATRLAETLLSWLLHQGRRDEVARSLHVHPQTVRYRMGQIRERFGDRLHEPGVVRDLVIALSAVRQG